jgi:hypothetical protein
MTKRARACPILHQTLNSFFLSDLGDKRNLIGDEQVEAGDAEVARLGDSVIEGVLRCFSGLGDEWCSTRELKRSYLTRRWSSNDSASTWRRRWRDSKAAT